MWNFCSFLLDDTMAPPGVNLSRIFHVQPPSSALYPTDKPQMVAVTFRSDVEFEIKNVPILKCQVSGGTNFRCKMLQNALNLPTIIHACG